MAFNTAIYWELVDEKRDCAEAELGRLMKEGKRTGVGVTNNHCS